jgi:hypothetical protein
MANRMYDPGRAAFGNAAISWIGDTIKVALVSGAYTPNTATHQFWSDVNANVIGTPQTLTSKTNVGGLMGAANPTFTAVPAGTVTYLVYFKDTGTPSGSSLIGIVDTATGLPVTANGGDITVTIDATNKIFKL